MMSIGKYLQILRLGYHRYSFWQLIKRRKCSGWSIAPHDGHLCYGVRIRLGREQPHGHPAAHYQHLQEDQEESIQGITFIPALVLPN